MKDKIFSGRWGELHCQGMSMDNDKKFIYYSFTTKLVKTDVEGNVVGSVDHIVGHLGCIDYCEDDGRIYASLEYKNDSIGKDILKTLGIAPEFTEDGFYIAIFDVDKIDRLNMDAEKDGVMRTVYLKTVVDDFKGTTFNNGKARKNIYGCSGIDGLAIGPDFGSLSKKNYLHVCYGVYEDNQRTDNDYQVILQYDTEGWWEKAQPLVQTAMHKCGPAEPRNRYFVYTGNTSYGIQNLEYDAFTQDYFLFVYRGSKPEFPNYDAFCINGKKAARREKLTGSESEGSVLTLEKIGKDVNGVNGIYFPFGSMGVHSLGNGEFYFVEPDFGDPKNLAVNSVRYRLENQEPEWKFVRVSAEEK